MKVEQDAAKVIAESQYTHINDVLLKKCEDAVIDKDLTHEVELGLSAIFGKRVPIFEEKRMALFNYASKNMPKNLLELYRMASNNKKNMASRDAAIEMARKVFSTVFPMTDGCGYDVVDRIYVAQEITDVIMKAYSPAAFIPKVFDEAADYFIISHRVVLAEELEKCEVKFNKKSYDIVKERGGDGADGSGKLEAFKKRKSDRNEDKQKEIENIRERAANISDTDYVEDYHIDAYEEQFQYNINDSKVFVESKDAVIKIFEKVDKNIAKSATKAFFRHINFYMPQVYENMKHIANCDGTLGDVMTYMSKEVFKLTYDHADAYILNKECRLALAQQLADEILTKFSPVNYSNACKGDYAKNFVIGNAANLKEVLGDNANLSDEEINKLKDDAVYASEHLDELVKAEAERRAEEARRKAEEEEAQRKAEEEAKRKAEEEEAQRKAEEEAKRKAEEEEAERKAEEEAKRKAEEEEAQRKAEEEAKRKAEEEDAKRKAEEEAKANEQPKEEPKPEENKAEEPKVDAEEEAKKKAEEEQRKLEISKNAAERKERWNIERQAQLEAANQIENQKQIADEMNGAYQRKLEEKKLAGVGIHELVETEIAFEEIGLPEFRLEVSSRLKRMYIYNTVQTSIDKILEKDIPDRDERTEIANNTADIIRRKMVALYSTAEEKKIDIFNNHESFQCLVDTFKEVYKLTDNCGLDFTRHIIIAQKITDSVMQNWSPAPKNNARNVTLFNGYFMQNSYALKGIIPGYDKSLHWKDIEKEFKKDATLHKSVIQARNADKRRKKELSDRLNSETSGVKDNTVIDDSQFEVFTKLFEHNVAVDEVQKKFKDAAADILKEIDPKVKNRSSKLLKEVSFDVSKIYHDLNKYIQHGGTFNDIMTYMAKKTFELCYYNYLKNDNLSQEKRIELSQKLSNVIMERFSPIVGTSKSSVSEDNYMDLVIKNEKLLGDILAKSEKDKAMSKEIENLKKEEAKKKAAELDAKRNYKRQVENPIDVPKRLEKSFVVACEEELENSLKDSQLSEAFKLQVAKVLEKMGLDKSKAEECANKVFKDVSGNSKGMRNIYNVMEDDVKTKYDPESFTKHMMDFLTNNFSKTVTDYFENVDVGIIASRNVMGVILRNYSPAAFTKGDAFNNGINSCLFDENGRIFLINYYYHYYNRDIHGDKRAHYNSAGEFVEKIQTNTEKYLKEEIKYERKLMDKYERKVEGVKLSKEDGDTLITMADLNVFKEECKNSIADPNLTEYVKWQIGEILADSGLEDAKIQSTIDNIFEKCTSDSGMLGFYDKANTSVYLQNYSKDNADMVMKKMLTDGMKLVSKATDGCYSNVEEGMAVNQKVLNVIFKNYSPVAFTNGALNKFAEDYFTTNTSMFGDYYRYNINDVGGWDQMRGIFDNFKAAVARLNNKAPVNEPAINDDEQPAPAEEKKEEAPAEVKKEEAPAEVKKEEAPTEVKKENVEPEKVKIVVHELIEAVGGKEVSPKIEEDSVSVASNKQK